jgi:hypothetical protein
MLNSFISNVGDILFISLEHDDTTFFAKDFLFFENKNKKDIR